VSGANLYADILMWVGILGVLEFAMILVVARTVGASHVGPAGRDPFGTALGRWRRDRINRGIRGAPTMVLVSTAIVVVGIIWRWAVAP
jgi:hypothetical protein